MLSKMGEWMTKTALPPRFLNLRQCAEAGCWDRYFETAELTMQNQWDLLIWPMIKDFDFENVLELAPGAGRNTRKLCRLSKKIYVVDYNAYALEKCRANLGESFEGCEISYHQNNGTDLSMIPSSAVSTVYCWDSAVHFERSVINGYVREFARVLRKGGRGFLHHSALGRTAHRNMKMNPDWRTRVSKGDVARMCAAAGLKVLEQADTPWWGDCLDCRTVFLK